jgi:hypothetical protein
MDKPDTTAAPKDTANAASDVASPPSVAAAPTLKLRHRFGKTLFHWRNVVAPLLVVAAFWLYPLVREMLQHWVVGQAIEDVKSLIGLGHHEPTKWRVLAVFPDPTSSTVSVPILDALGFKNGVSRQPLIE